MQRREFLITLAGGLVLGVPAYAAFSDDVVAQLMAQGYRNISQSRTWLGRVRILAYRDGGVREIVMNPRTGEILRDLWTAVDGSSRSVSIVDDVKSHDGGSNGGSGQDGSGGSGSGKASADDQGDDLSGSDSKDDSPEPDQSGSDSRDDSVDDTTDDSVDN